MAVYHISGFESGDGEDLSATKLSEKSDPLGMMLFAYFPSINRQVFSRKLQDETTLQGRQRLASYVGLDEWPSDAWFMQIPPNRVVHELPPNVQQETGN